MGHRKRDLFAKAHPNYSLTEDSQATNSQNTALPIKRDLFAKDHPNYSLTDSRATNSQNTALPIKRDLFAKDHPNYSLTEDSQATNSQASPIQDALISFESISPRQLKSFLASQVSEAPAGPGHSQVWQWLDSIYPRLSKHNTSPGDVRPPLPPRDPIDCPSSQLSPRKPRQGKPHLCVVAPNPVEPALGSKFKASSELGTPETATRIRLVDSPDYRRTNLALNHIHLQPHRTYPKRVADLVGVVGRRRGSFGSTLEQVQNDMKLQALVNEGPELDVMEYLLHTPGLFPRTAGEGAVTMAEGLSMLRRTIPTSNSSEKVSRPVPDMLYGYSWKTLPARQYAQRTKVNHMRLEYPFLAVEFEGNGTDRAASFWGTTNRCLGSSASCVKVEDKMVQEVQGCGLQGSFAGPMASAAAFSIAINATLATVYVTWKEDEKRYFASMVKAFALQEPEQFVGFGNMVRNIIDWGSGTRLEYIKGALNALIEQDKQQARMAAKKLRSSPGDRASQRDAKRRRVSKS